ncbi:MAG: Rrf2 family transcriptional regulator [Candidatus Marinimicrobia bacterium]|nr:Rrf2 family transcriptional regulator [Candidatus Neomarinimicrobiota bacterium]MCF7828033.1 Rrf2 family transcriptional regulator [Candidatus Neomarinimicrobiota bacterium]MCF7879212.1 Rrf2 family transcriptional regulator [Candidatus Neomarinimicrobiota bacterium]
MKCIISEQEKDPDVVVSATEIAERFNIPRGILGKVLQQLARNGMIKSYQGVTGGYVLDKAPEDINLNDIVRIIEGPISMVECSTNNGEECSQLENCNIKSPILTIQRNLTNYFKNISLADL